MQFILFSLCAGLVGIASIIMFFHWRRYGMGGATFALVEVVYLSVSATLLAIAFFSIN